MESTIIYNINVVIINVDTFNRIDQPPVIVPKPMLGIPIWGGVTLAPLDCIVPLGGVAVKGGAAVPFTLDGQAAERYPLSKRRKGSSFAVRAAFRPGSNVAARCCSTPSSAGQAPRLR